MRMLCRSARLGIYRYSRHACACASAGPSAGGGELARDAGLSYAALHAWITGIRSPRAGSLVQLAEGLESRADALRELAAQLRRAAERR
ncbi:MAG TPA: helix-turn-helix transcriptional regulator [Longimicrobium sp.]|nr:helix-turn-helix transcriptional regulator [Longimicrobium sp.]